MKILIVGDIHWSRYSSIFRHRGEKYSLRLENCIESINWVEQTATIYDCNEVVYLGDFFDSSELNSEEITALADIKWNNLPHKFLVGNHEMGINDLSYSSSHIFNHIKHNNFEVVDRPFTEDYNATDITFTYIPYILEDDRKPLEDYIHFPTSQNHIIFSHNDIAGIQMGQFKSVSGFSIEEIEDNCSYFFNGHLHNGTNVTEKIINVGNLTGQNFSEDGYEYEHHIYIFDTDTMSYQVIKNPYAINFYKIDTREGNAEDLRSLENAVVTVKCPSTSKSALEEFIKLNKNIIAHRFIISSDDDIVQTVDNNKELLAVNHLDKFKDFVLSNIGDSEIIRQELQEVMQ